MIKGDKGRMPLSMIDKLYFSKRRPKTAIIKRTKAVRRHLLTYKLKAEPKPEEK